MIGERIKQLRIKLGLNQLSFGNKIGLSNSGVGKIELGRTNLSNQVQKSLIREFNVNEDWLLNGTGEMFIENDNSILNQLSKEYNLDDLDFKILETYLSLSESQRDAMKAFILNLTEKITLDEETK